MMNVIYKREFYFYLINIIKKKKKKLRTKEFELVQEVKPSEEKEDDESSNLKNINFIQKNKNFIKIDPKVHVIAAQKH